MTNFNMEVKGFNRVANKLRTLAAKMDEITSDEIYKWAQQTRADLKAEPYPAKNEKSKTWASDKQRKYVMAAIREGRIQVPYRRTGGLANRWSAARTTKGAVIRNSARYAKYVVGDEQGLGQNKEFHKGRWYQARQDVIDKRLPAMRKMLARRLLQEWRK